MKLLKSTEQILISSGSLCRRAKVIAKELSVIADQQKKIEDKNENERDQNKLDKLKIRHNETIEKFQKDVEKHNNEFLLIASIAKTPKESIEILNSVIEKESISSFKKFLEDVLAEMKKTLSETQETQ